MIGDRLVLDCRPATAGCATGTVSSPADQPSVRGHPSASIRRSSVVCSVGSTQVWSARVGRIDREPLDELLASRSSRCSSTCRCGQGASGLT
jgi:hypothetical protein